MPSCRVFITLRAFFSLKRCRGGFSVRFVQLMVLASLVAASFDIRLYAAEVAPLNIEKYAIAKPVTGVEKDAAIERTATLDGTQYAVIAPIFTELNTGNYSFIRFQNLISTASTFTVKVVGSPSGNVYGTTTVTVSAGASVHKPVGDLLTATNASTLTGGDTAYALYLSNPDLSGYQHVIYSYVSKFFENASLCQTSLSQASVRYLPNVHTKIIADAGFPSKIFIHNYYNTAVTYNVAVYEASAGALIGTVPVVTQANSTYALDESFFEAQLNWTPTGSQGYANLIFTPKTAIAGVTLPPVTVGHFIFNQAFQAYVNMSDSCAVNAGSASTGSAATAATTTYAGTIASSGDFSGTLTVNIPTSAISASAATTATAVERSKSLVNVTAKLVIFGTNETIPLTGTYETTTRAITLVGGGYTFTGTVNSQGKIDGTWTGPSNRTGAWGLVDTSRTFVTAYCGTFKFTGTTITGNFNITTALSGALTGTYSSSEGAGRLSGTVTGSTFTGTSTGGDTVTGTVSGTTISGSFTDGQTHGTFTGNKCALPAA
jgi:hypothetical protein